MHGKILLSSALVAAGAALAAGGPGVFAALAGLVWRDLPLLIFAGAGVMVLVSIVPRRALVGPVALSFLGLGVLLVRSHGWPVVGRFGGAALLTLVGVLLALRRDEARDANLRRRRWAVLAKRRLPSTKAPAVIRLVAIGGRLKVDLTHAKHERKIIQVFVSSWISRVAIVVPTKWVVVAGRLSAARGIRFDGELDAAGVFLNPDENQGDIDELERIRSKAASPEGTKPCVMVVHVLGAGGIVSIGRQSS